MATIIYPHTFVPNTPARASEVNANFDAITDEVNGNIDADNLADNAVTAAKIEDGAVTTAKLNDGAVSEAKLASGAVTSAKIGDGAVVAAKLGDLAVQTSKLNNSAVTEAKIGPSAVTESKIASAAVTELKLGSGAVTATKLASGAVTTTKIADSAVTLAKTSGLFGSNAPAIYFGSIPTSGAATSLPTGWSFSRTSTGVYDVTHNLGTTSLFCLTSVSASSTSSVEVENLSSSVLRFRLYNNPGSPTNFAMSFCVIRYA